MEEKEVKFELEVVSDKSSGVLKLGDYDKSLKLANEILTANPVFPIENDTDKKIAKDIRARLNKVAEQVSRVRIDSVDEFTRDFSNQCKEIGDLFKARADEFGKVIKPYEEAQKLVAGEALSKPKVITCTVKFYDEKILNKIIDFCTKNGCELSVK
jgi:recombinational DNA repair ATPase RecF